jgi:hypothetical protein
MILLGILCRDEQVKPKQTAHSVLREQVVIEDRKIGREVVTAREDK